MKERKIITIPSVNVALKVMAKFVFPEMFDLAKKCIIILNYIK